MKNKLSNNELNDLLSDWTIFRNEELSRLTKDENNIFCTLMNLRTSY